MSEKEYLTFLGYTPTTDWTVLKPEEYKPLLNVSGYQNNMYPASDPKGVELFGKNAKIVKKAWYNKNTNSTNADDVTLPPPPPILNSGPEPVIPVKEEEEKSLLEVRLENLSNKGIEINRKLKTVVFPTGEVSFETIENYPNNVWIKVLAKDYSKVAEVIEETPIATYDLSKEKRVEMLNNLGLSFDLGVFRNNERTVEITAIDVNTKSDQDFNNSYEAIKGYLDAAAEKENLGKQLSKEDEAEKIKEAIVEKSGIPSDNIIVASPPKVEFVESNDDAAEAFDLEKQKEIEEDFECDVDTETISDEEFDAVINDKPFDSKKEQKPEEVQELVSEQNFFSRLNLINFQQVNISINKSKDGKLGVVVKPNNFSGDPAYDNIKPLNLTGSPEELDKGFFEAIQKPLEVVNGLMVDAKSFLDDVKAQEKKTKAAAKLKEDIKKAVESAKKYHDIKNDKEFDYSKKSAITTATKKWNAVLELDATNKDALAGIEKLKSETSQQTIV